MSQTKEVSAQEPVVIPKFSAMCDDETDGYRYSGEGETLEEAYLEFLTNGQFEEQCADWMLAPGDDIEVYIYSVIDIKDSDWPEDERETHWVWCLDEKVETRIAEAV